MCPSTPKPPSLQKHSRSCSPPRRHFHPDGFNALSHPGAFPLGDFNSIISQQHQHIIYDLHIQLRNSILPHVLNVSTPSNLDSYELRRISLHAISMIKLPSSRFLQQTSTCRLCDCEDHAHIIRPHACSVGPEAFHSSFDDDYHVVIVY